MADEQSEASTNFKSGDIVRLQGTVVVEALPYSDKIVVALGPNDWIVVSASECKPV